MSDSRLYSRLLLPKGHGYPLFHPQPFDDVPLEARLTGTQIGDVGIITPDGAFDVVFNICRAPDDPVNRFGVPEGFEQVILGGGDIAPWDQYHRVGSHVSSTQLSKRRLDLNVTVDGNVFVPIGVGAMVEISTASRQAAVLLLPDGASRINLRRLKKFRDYALKHAPQWYQFVNGPQLERMIDNGDLYLVTGCDKSSSWSVAALDNRGEGCGVSLKLMACPAGSTAAAYTWEWETASSFANSGPRTRMGEETWTDNQTIFLRGFKVAIRTLPLRKSPKSKVRSIVGSKSSDILSKTISSTPSTSSTGFGMRAASSLFRRSSGPRDLESIGDVCKPYHPADAINAYLLESCPDALVAVTHDNDWISVLDAGETIFEDDDELLTRIRDRYKPVVLSEGVYLERADGSEVEGNESEEFILASEFEGPAGDAAYDAERLASLGESVLHLVLTSLIMEMYPELGMDVMRSIRGKILDDWSLTELFTKEDIGVLYNDLGFEITTKRLDGILRPLVRAIYESFRNDGTTPTEKHVAVDSPPSSPERESTMGSYLATFNEQLQKGQRRAEWSYAEGTGSSIGVGKEKETGVRGNKNGVWRAEVTVDGVVWGTGEGGTKKVARNECARQALERTGGSS